MSVIRKIPTIEKVLDTLSVERLKSLETLLNSGTKEPTLKTLYNSENVLKYKNVDNGVWLVAIELAKGKEIKTGFLVWVNETVALLISYDISQNIYLYEINVEDSTCKKINEECSLEELRRVLEDNINKEVVHIDTKGDVEVGKNLIVDGKIVLNGKEDLVDTEGNVLINSGGGDEEYTLVLNETDSGSFYFVCLIVGAGHQNRFEYELEGEYDFTKIYKYLALTGDYEGTFLSFSSLESQGIGGLYVYSGNSVAFLLSHEAESGTKVVAYRIPYAEDDTLWLSDEDAEKFKTCLNAVLTGEQNFLDMDCKTKYEWKKSYQYLGIRGEGNEETTIRIITNHKPNGLMPTSHYGLYVLNYKTICPIEFLKDGASGDYSIRVVKPIG